MRTGLQGRFHKEDFILGDGYGGIDDGMAWIGIGPDIAEIFFILNRETVACDKGSFRRIPEHSFRRGFCDFIRGLRILGTSDQVFFVGSDKSPVSGIG